MPQLTRHFAHWPAGVPRSLEVADCNLFCHLEESATRVPDKPAVVFYGHRMTFHDLHAAAMALAGYLQHRLSVRQGDRVLLLMQNCPQYMIAFYAVMRCDAVVVAMNPMSTREEMEYYARDSGARVVIATQDLIDPVTGLLEQDVLDGCVVGLAGEFAGRPKDVPYLAIPGFVTEPRQGAMHPRMHDFSQALAAGIAPLPVRARGRDLAVIGYTSGTTGKPKGAMLSHANFAYTLAHREHWQSDRADEDELLTLPVSHLAGMRAMNQAVRLGRTLAMLTRWDANAALELIERLRLRSWAAVPTMLAELFARPDIDQRDLSSLTRIYGGASAMPEALARRMQSRLGIPFLESYGLTEFCGMSHSNPPQAPRRQCAGVPVINCDARVINPETGVELGTNEPGEIVMHGPTMFGGYWNKPEATAAAFIELDGKRFLRSGDLGYHDEDGYFYITDRLKRMINASGLKVWPAEIESILYGHPAVQEACVISAFDPHRGETVKALVVLRPASRGMVQPQALVDWARGCMSAYKVPRTVEFVDSLPKTSTGKILWREMQLEQDERDREARGQV
ncbi:long-chain-fatty-acid--CoA ligase [Cupriavidus necator]|uniref:long-chain-fatty-acid--CoA ligase n=1 Tax=Cupriavidus necator TaxID=106590 RepID=UPI0005B37955|nr:long-chain-fatty-acid--CoA ligase [Cupriavidus necator]